MDNGAFLEFADQAPFLNALLKCLFVGPISYEAISVAEHTVLAIDADTLEKTHPVMQITELQSLLEFARRAVHGSSHSALQATNALA
ncbi:hypothetical protein [Hyphomicrobium sp. 2TAF46]|uniref:hypothetical protein n=1 Tax=Hyphomicrobium sp. 2TAF46 TaxID=3233019 RepID=UPI003F9275AF